MTGHVDGSAPDNYGDDEQIERGEIMSANAEDLVRVNQFKFIAKIVSLYGHDLNNQLGTIKEASGLMEDLVERSKSKDNRLKEDLARPLNSIYNRVGNAAFITSRLCAFGRGMAQGDKPLNINEAVGDLLVLVKRVAARKRIELITDFQADIPAVHADPLMLQFLLYCLLEEHLMRLKAKGRLVFRTACKKNVVSVMILPEGDEEPSDEQRTFPEGMAQAIAETCGFGMAARGRENHIVLNL